MKNGIYIFISLYILAFPLVAQEQEEPKYITVQGNILDSESHEPVDAKIFYESLPYGNKVGVFSGTTFGFKMEEGKSYAINVKADGYEATNKQFKPDMSIDGVITDTIYLAPKMEGKIIRLESLVFAQRSSKVPTSAYSELDHFVDLMKSNPTMLIQLEGHTDYRGDDKKNMELSEDRVKATRDYMVDKGIDKKRIEIIAFGGTKPLLKSNDPESYRLNRRVELRILQY